LHLGRVEGLYQKPVFCRQGRRYSRRVQTALQCSSSTTACGYFEFSSPDTKTGVNSVGIYECVDNGILQTTNDDLEEDNSVDLYSNCNLFSQICGAVAQCSHLNLDILNPAFVKYLVLHHDIQLESLTSRTIRFCCSLFHHTRRIFLAPTYYNLFTSISATPIHCQSEICGEEDGDDGQGEVTVRRQKAKRQTNEYQEIDAVQVLNQNQRKRLKCFPEDDDEEESYCVYRHLNDEMYRYCLLVHQKKDGDRYCLKDSNIAARGVRK
uniref:Thyroglobulin type-1 domain-containing protein n=1 Tax=Heligmosomoides polygyrus TaxID=6339 RepID=A0A183GBR3_HELPZ